MNKRLILPAALLLASICNAGAFAATYYINPTGDDSKDGTTEATAWKTVAKVNASAFQPGDQILFFRGGEWRESLAASSDGAADKPIIYAAYGNGAKPKFWGSEVMSNADFQPVDEPTSKPADGTTSNPVAGSTYKYVFKHDVNRHMGIAVDHELVPWTGFSKPGGGMMTVDDIKQSPRSYWIDDGFNTTAGTNILYINTGGSDPRTDGKLYTICIRQNVVTNAFKSHLIFRDLVVDETASLESGYAFRIDGGADIRIENCEAYRVGVAHFGIVNGDGIVFDHLKAAYAMPNQTYIRNSAYFINNSGNTSVQILDCVAEHLDCGADQPNSDVLVSEGSSTGNVLVKNLTCTADGGGGITLGGSANVKIVGGALNNAHVVVYSNNVVLDGLTITGNSCVDFFGSGNLLQNCKLVNINPQHGGPSAYSCGVLCRDKSEDNTIRFCTMTMSSDAPGNAVLIALAGKGAKAKWYGNIMVGNPRVFGFTGTPDASDVVLADYNLYAPSATFTDANTTFADWKTAGFDQHSLTGDANFTDAANGDYSPKPGSLAIGAAKIDAAQRPPTDINNIARPAGNACTIGAYEVSGGASPATGPTTAPAAN